MSALLATGLAVPGRLHRTELALEAGTLTLLAGPNGAGKTTLLHGLARIGGVSGEVHVGGVPIGTLAPAQRLRRLSFLPALREIGWPLVARDLVALGLPGDDAGGVEAALAKVAALPFADRRIDQLSTGERARVLLARALVAEPAVLLLDEPVANLDPAWQLKVLAVLRAEAARGAAVLASIHDLALARAWPDRVIVVRDGAIVADGPPDEALTESLLAEVFEVRWEDRRGWASIA